MAKLPFAHLPVPSAHDLRQAAPAIAAALRVPAERQAQPWAPGKPWTTAQMAWHLVDVESVMLDRIRRVLAQEQPDLPGVPPDVWTAGLPARPMPLAADLFLACRGTIAALIDGLPVAALARTGRHAEFGAMTLTDLLQHLHGHSLHHARQLAG